MGIGEVDEAHAPADVVRIGVAADTVVRCRRCQHPLTAALSVRLELGPTCRTLVEAA